MYPWLMFCGISLADFCVRVGKKIKMQSMHEGLGVCLNGSKGGQKVRC